MWRQDKKQLVTKDSFKKEYGFHPVGWSTTKALAGCVSDGVRGIKGVGEGSVLKYMTNKLPSSSCYHKRLEEGKEEALERNLPLVKLPYKGTPKLQLVKDNPSPKAWRELTERLNMKSLVTRCPFKGGNV